VRDQKYTWVVGEFVVRHRNNSKRDITQFIKADRTAPAPHIYDTAIITKRITTL